MTMPKYNGLRGSFAPHTAQRRLDYWRGIDSARAAAELAAELGGADLTRPYRSIDYKFDRLVEAQIEFALAQLRVTANSSAAPEAQSPDPGQPA